MSLNSSSSKWPLAAALVFFLGIGLGLSWKLGLIPLEYGPAPAGTLEESDQAATDDSSGTASDRPLADADEEQPAWTVDQGEPPVAEGINLKHSKSAETNSPDEPGQISADEESVPIIRAAKPPAFARSSRQPRANSERVRQAKFQTEEEPGSDAEESKPAVEEPVEKPVPEPADRFAEIDEKLAAGEFLTAHKALSKMFWNAKRPDAELESRLEATATKIFFSSQPHFIEPYVVQAGDQLQKIAKKHNLSWEYLAKLNKTDPKRIREGQKLKVLKGPFAAIVSLRDYSLTIHLQGYYVKRYQVGIGKDGSSPIGKFPVLGKLENPQYTDPDGKVIEGDDPQNPLGERWIDLGDSYGIHGTIEPESIGTAASRGCIRLSDADIIEVYNFLVPGSTVEIRE